MIAASPDALIGFFVAILFIAVGGFSCARLVPLLSPIGKGIALSFLALHTIVITLCLLLHPSAPFDRWLWDLHEEWNIPASLASVQLGLVGGLALMTAWLARGVKGAFRLYMLGIAIVFFFLGLDEYLALHEFIMDWELRYIALGIVVVAATLLLARTSSRRARIWYAVFLFGLALSVAGALALNALPVACETWLFFRFDGCIEFYGLEEALEFLGIWLTLIAILGHFADAVPSPSRLTSRLMAALPAVWIALLVLNALLPRLELRFAGNEVSVEFDSGIRLLGYSIDKGARHVNARLYARARQADYIGLGYSLHLVDQVSGDSVAGVDEWADRQHGIWILGPDFEPVYRQSFSLPIPPETAANRVMSIVLSLWRRGRGGYERQAIVESDAPTLSDTQVVLGEMALRKPLAVTSTQSLGSFENGFALQGVELPEVVAAGETLSVTFTWRSEVEGALDYGQFLHLGHDESGEWFVHDQPPLGDRLPTRLWYAGLHDSETWSVLLPDDLAPGRYSVFTGLYRVSDKERLPVKDAAGAPWSDARVALGSLIVEP